MVVNHEVVGGKHRFSVLMLEGKSLADVKNDTSPYHFVTSVVADVVALCYGQSNTMNFNATGLPSLLEGKCQPFEYNGFAISNPFLDDQYFCLAGKKDGSLINPAVRYKQYKDWKTGMMNDLVYSDPEHGSGMQM